MEYEDTNDQSGPGPKAYSQESEPPEPESNSFIASSPGPGDAPTKKIARPKLQRGLAYSPLNSHITNGSSPEKLLSQEPILSIKLSLTQFKNSAETPEQTRLRQREMLRHVHYHQSPEESKNFAYNFGDQYDVPYMHAQLLRERLNEIVQKTPCITKTCFLPRRTFNHEASSNHPLDDDHSDWVHGTSIEALLESYLDGEVRMFRTTYLASPSTSPVLTPALMEAVPYHHVQPTLISPPSQPLTPQWTMKECDPLDDHSMPLAAGSPSGKVEFGRPKARTRTLESISEVMTIKKLVEEEVPIEKETTGIRAMKMIKARYQAAGKPWVYPGLEEPVGVWVEEWSQEPVAVLRIVKEPNININ